MTVQKGQYFKSVQSKDTFFKVTNVSDQTITLKGIYGPTKVEIEVKKSSFNQQFYSPSH